MLRFLLPARCACCDTYLQTPGICEVCFGGFLPLREACVCCAQPLESTHPGDLCDVCARTGRAFEKAHVPWLYGGVLQGLVARVKTSKDPALLRGIAPHYRDFLRQAVPQGARLTVVPMHPKDLAERGFSVPSLLAKFCGVPVEHVVSKNRKTDKQSGLGRLSRLSNLDGAFSCRPVQGTWVVLDDVMTTGSTLEEVARTLREAGASNVRVVALARTP